jgi:hypothetical protein
VSSSCLRRPVGPAPLVLRQSVQVERPPLPAPALRNSVSFETSASENSFVRARCDTPEGRAERARQVVMYRNVHICR